MRTEAEIFEIKAKKFRNFIKTLKRYLDGKNETFIFENQCEKCGRIASKIEITPPFNLPSVWNIYTPENRVLYSTCWDSGLYRGIYKGTAAGSGDFGYEIEEKIAKNAIKAFSTKPYRYELIKKAGFFDDGGYCGECEKFYCYTCWTENMPWPHSGCCGICPNAHNKVLDYD